MDTVDKARLFELAQRNGLAVAEGGVAEDDNAAISIAMSLGFPVIVRQMFGSAGRGAARCESVDEMRAAIRAFPSADAWSPHGGQRLVVQRWIDGAVVNRASVAWEGKEIAGFTRARGRRSRGSALCRRQWYRMDGPHRPAARTGLALGVISAGVVSRHEQHVVANIAVRCAVA